VTDPDPTPTTWPALTYETLPWELSETVPVSRTARRRYRGTYEAAVVPEIVGQDVLLPAEVAALVEDASTEVARFDSEMGTELAPFSAILLRSESAASSKIENLTASARAIAEAELHPRARGNASLIVANTRSMNAAIALSDRIDADAILKMHEALLSQSSPDIAGRWRREQVWIGGSDLGPHGALFVPPRHDRVPESIEDLVAFIDRDDIPVLVHAALAHAQFETIHPFPDGNGRTGRALLHAQLRNKGLTRNVTVPVSAGLLTNTDEYFDVLSEYRNGNPLLIVASVARASLAAVGNGRQLIRDLRGVRSSWDERVKVRRGATAWKIADLLLRHPVVNAPLIAEELGIAGQNTYRSLQPLVDADVLVEFSDRKRNQLWRAPEALEALDRFAARAGRRSRSAR
jgi:Fic family protein